jgi:hypothetical protein
VLKTTPIPRFLLGFALAMGLVWASEQAAVELCDRWIPDARWVQSAEGGAHPFLLWEPEPGAQELAGVSVEINRMGMRGPMPVSPKPARERRLMVLGDGLAFGEGVHAHQTLGQVAVDMLGGERVGLELINAGVEGYSTLQSLNLMELRGWSLEPDVLVIVESPTDWQIGPHADERVVPWARPPGVLAELVRRSAVLRLLDYQLGVLHGKERRRYLRIRAGEEAGNPEDQPRLGPNMRARALRALVVGAQLRGVDLAFVLSPLPADLQAELPAEVEVYRQVLRDAARVSGAVLIEGGELLAQTGRPASELWLDGVHPTVLGHRVLGRALAGQLRRWIRGGSAGGKSRGGALPDYRVPTTESE